MHFLEFLLNFVHIITLGSSVNTWGWGGGGVMSSVANYFYEIPMDKRF